MMAYHDRACHAPPCAGLSLTGSNNILRRIAGTGTPSHTGRRPGLQTRSDQPVFVVASG